MPPAPTSTKTVTASAEDASVPVAHSGDENGMNIKSASISNGKPETKMSNGNGYANGTLTNGNAVNGTAKKTKKIYPLYDGVKTNGFVKVKDEDEEQLFYGQTPLKIVWRNVIIFVYLHMAALYGGYLWLSGQIMWQTFLWGFKYYVMSGFGITAGNHRYYAHKSYKAKMPLQILLVYMQTCAFQNSIHEWCRDHRIHHKFTETNADPHNAHRGFFFAHMGWLMAKKHEAIKLKGKSIDMSDLEADPIVMFQKKYYLWLVLFGCFIIPTIVPWLFWGESLVNAFFFAAMFRYCATLHCTWLVNSAAHLWGPKPYDKRINPAENKTVSWWAFGEGFHNYHHIFPWDYKTAEIGIYRYNFSAAFIDFMAKIGWAYDLKTVPESVVKARVLRTGDGSHDHFHGGPWGWGDEDIPLEAAEVTQTLYAHNEKSE